MYNNEQESKEIQAGLEDIKKGRTFSIESVARELEVILDN